LADRAGVIERAGIGEIQPHARINRPRDLFWVLTGFQLTYGTLLTGAVPLALGLSWPLAALTIVAGSLAGGVAVAAMAPVATATGTNATVASGTAFGIRGRILGSVIVQLLDVFYFALSLIIAVPAIDEALHRLAGLPAGHAVVPTMAVTAALTVALAVLGNRTLIAAQRLNALLGIAGIAVLSAAAILHLAHAGLPAPPPPPAAAAILAAVAIQFANVISYAPYVGDNARYIPRAQGRRAFIAAFAAIQTGAVSLIAGLIIALAVPHPAQALREMVDLLPLPFVVPVVFAGALANVTSGGLLLYNGMLDLQSLLWRWSRLQAGLLFVLAGIAFAILSLLAFDLIDTLETLCTIVGILVAPWIAIVATARLPADPALLQDFAGIDPSNPYRGLDLPALLAWAAGAATGLAVHLAAPVDLGIPAGMLVAFSTRAWAVRRNRSGNDPRRP
jgi:purine-cytosine permease-like protein